MIGLWELAGRWAEERMYAAAEKKAPAKSVLKWLSMPLLMANEGYAKQTLRGAALLCLGDVRFAHAAWEKYGDPAGAGEAWDGVRLFARYLNYWRNAAGDAATLAFGPGSEKSRAQAQKSFEENCACALAMLEGPARACYGMCFCEAGGRVREAETEMQKVLAEIGILAGKMGQENKERYAAAAGNLLACAPSEAASRLLGAAAEGRLGKLGMAALAEKALLAASCAAGQARRVSKPGL